MDVHLEDPEEFARRLGADPKGLARVASEALAAEDVRSGKLTTFQARGLLGLRSRYEMDGFLKAHGVFLDLTYYFLADSQIWLMTVYDKDSMTDLSPAEKRVLKTSIERETRERARRRTERSK